MHISDSFETRDHPETRPSRITATEPELMASLLLRVNPGNKSRLIEPYPNSEPVPKKFLKIQFWLELPALVPIWIQWGNRLILLMVNVSLRRSEQSLVY